MQGPKGKDGHQGYPGLEGAPGLDGDPGRPVCISVYTLSTLPQNKALPYLLCACYVVYRD